MAACPPVKAVPSDATASVKPAWCMAMTSIYPSHKIRYPFRDVLAKFMPYKFRLLSKTTVSGEFRYFGSPSPMTRPPKPMTLLLISWMGNITRFQNLSCSPYFSWKDATPESTISLSVYPLDFKYKTKSSLLTFAYPSANFFMVSSDNSRFLKYFIPTSPCGARSWK